MNRTTLCKKNIQSIHDYITDPDNLEAHRSKGHFVRKRKLSMFQIILYLLYTSKASMFQNLSRIKDELITLDFPNVSKQAVSKARQFIHPDLFKELFYLSVDLFYKHIPHRKLWHGYHLFAIDGSKLELPNTKQNLEFFGTMFDFHNPDRLYTMGLASIVYDVLDDYIVHASLHHSLSSERCAALEHLKNLEDLNIYQDSVVIFDRGYYSEKMFRYCVQHQHLCLMLEEFTGATTISVFQEFYINLLFSNLSSLIKNQADNAIKISTKNTNKYRYQANRSFIIGRMKTIFPKILCQMLDFSAIDRLYSESVRCRSQIIPDRSFHRRKSKTYGRNHFKNQKVAF